MPDYPVYVLRAGRRFQDEKRITITTLQSMINIYSEYSPGYLPVLAHESFSVTARLKTGAPGRESLWSATK